MNDCGTGEHKDQKFVTLTFVTFAGSLKLIHLSKIIFLFIRYPHAATLRNPTHKSFVKILLNN